MQNVVADLAVESEAATALGAPARGGRRPARRRPRGGAAPDRAAAGEVLGVQAHPGHGRRGAGVPGRQRVRRGVRHAAALPRVPAQLRLGGLGQRQRARRAARAVPRARGAGGVDHRGRRGPRRGPAPRPRGRRHPRACSATSPRSRSPPAGSPARWPPASRARCSSGSAPPEVADAFCASRLGASYNGTFGTLAGGDLRRDRRAHDPGGGLMATREWDASTYDALPLPHVAWGQRVLDRMRLEGDERVLDAGCGTGRDGEALLERWPDVRPRRHRRLGADDRRRRAAGSATAPSCTSPT